MTEELIYFRDGELVAESGDAKVYKMAGELFLELGPGHTLWALESELEDYKEQLQSYPRGDCLEIGLGLGTASRYILTFPKVNSLTTIELNPDVIELHGKIKPEDRKYNLDYDSSKHKIYNADGIHYAYQTKQKYDFIFMDFYDIIDEETLPVIADTVLACSRIIKADGKIMGWLDKSTPGLYYMIFQDIFTNY